MVLSLIRKYPIKTIALAVIVIVALIIAIVVFIISIINRQNHAEPTPAPTPTQPQESVDTPRPTSVNYEIQTVAEGLSVPWSIVFTSEDRFLVSERGGAIRVVENGQLQGEPLVTFPAFTQSEDGLMGLAADPNYDETRYLYACYTTANRTNSIVRFVDQPGGGEQTTVLGNIPAAQYHAGCRLKFGPDNMLYITTGDASNAQIAQDINSLGGKILRINSDGSIPEDNPFGNAVWSYGHRNPQGIDWQPETNNLIATEHGPSGFDGAPGGDEVNFIERGGNYGWPLVSHGATRDGTVAPLLTYTPAVAPASGLFYRSDALPQFTGQYFFGGLIGEGLFKLTFDAEDRTRIVANEKMSDVNVGRVRDVAESPDGAIYFSTSNRDGRGSVREGDDKIYRLMPQP